MSNYWLKFDSIYPEYRVNNVSPKCFIGMNFEQKLLAPKLLENWKNRAFFLLKFDRNENLIMQSGCGEQTLL